MRWPPLLVTSLRWILRKWSKCLRAHLGLIWQNVQDSRAFSPLLVQTLLVETYDTLKQKRDFYGSEIAADISTFRSPLYHGWKLRVVGWGGWRLSCSVVVENDFTFQVSLQLGQGFCICVCVYVHGWMLNSKQMGLFVCNFLNNCISSRASFG